MYGTQLVSILRAATDTILLVGLETGKPGVARNHVFVGTTICDFGARQFKHL